MGTYLACSLTAVAQDEAPEQDDLGAFLSASEEPLQVEADEMRYDASNGHAEAIGNAILHQENKKITADHLVLNFEKKEQEWSSDQSMESLIATGHVRMTSDENTVEAQKAVYNVAQALLTLEGDAIKVHSPKGILHAHQTVSYDRNNNVFQ